MQLSLEVLCIEILPITPMVAALSCRLPGDLHADPADRLIVSTALHYGLHLVTFDSQIRRYPHLTTLPR